MKRFTPLMLAGVVGLAACAEDRSAPLSPETASLNLETSSSDISGRHVFIFSKKSVPSDFAARVAAAGGTIEQSFPQIGIVAVQGLNGEGAARLGASGDIAHWSSDVEVALDRPVGEPVVEAVDAAFGEEVQSTSPAGATFFPRQWHLRAIGADMAWAAGRLGSPAVKVGILDTGLDYTHPDLVGRVDLALSRSFTPSDDPIVQAAFPGAHLVADLHYHGTHVGATVASNGVAAAGVTSQVTLVGIKVLNRNGSGEGWSVLNGIMYAADAKLDVINMSLGVASPLARRDYAWFFEMMNRAMTYAHEQGVTVVISAGNENMNLDRMGNGFKAYCSMSTISCVSATGPTARQSLDGPWTDIDAKAVYSNFGRSHIDVAAPGDNSGGAVTAACSRFSLAIPVCRTGTFVVGISGTSMAAPHVAGLAALMVEDLGRNPGRIRQRLHQTADDLGQRGTDPIYGKGRINVARYVGSVR